MNQKLLQLIITLRDEASAGLASLSSTLGSVGGMLSGAFTAALIGAGVAIAGLAVGSVGAAADFQSATATFASVAGGSLAAAGFSLQDVADKALQMGAATQFSAAEAQQAMIGLAKGGVPVVDIMGQATQATLDLAAAGEVGLAQAADIVAKQLGVWGSTGVTATQVANQLAQAANASTVDVDELALGLANVGGVAKASGVSFTDLNQTMAMIAPGFSSASDAGTSLKTFLLALQPQTKQATAAMISLGLATADGTSKFYDSQGAFIGMDKAAGLLHTSMAGLSDAEQSAALKAIFGTDAFRAAALIAEQGAPGFEAMGAAMDAAGTAAEQAAIRSATFKFAWDSLLGSIETIQIVIGSALLPVLTSLVNDALIPAANGVLVFIQALLGSQSAIGQLSPFLQSLMATLGTVWAALDTVATAFNQGGTLSLQFATALDVLGAALGIPAGILPAISFAVQYFGAQLYAVGDAIGAFLLGLGDFGTVADLLIELFGVTIGGLIADSIQVIANYAQVWYDLGTTIYTVIAALMGGDVAGAWAALTNGIAQVVADYQVYAASLIALLLGLGQSIIATIMTYAPMIAAQLLTWGQAFISWISPYIPIVLQTLTTFVAQIVAWIVAQAPVLYQQVLAWGAAFVDWISPYAALALAALTTFVTSVWAWIVAQAPGFVAQLAAWGAAFVAWVAPYAALALAALSGLVASIWGWISAQAPGFMAQLAAWGAAFVAWVSPAISSVLSALAGFGSSVSGWISAQAKALLSSFNTWAAAMIAWIPGATVSFLAAWPGMLNRFLDWIGSAVGPLLAKLGTWAVAFVQWIVPMIPGFIVALAGIALALGAFILETAAVLASKIKAWGIALTGWIATEVLPKLPGMWESFKTSVISLILSGASAVGAAALSLGKNIVSGIIAGVGSMASALGEKLKSMASGALSAAKNVLGIHSPSTVMAEQVGVPIVDGIVAGLGAASPKLTGKMLELAGQMVDLVSKGVDAFGKLRDLGSISFGAIQTFTNTMQQAMTLFAEMALQWDKAMMSAASQFARKSGEITDAMVKGVDFLLKLQTYQGVAPAVITAFAENLGLAMTELIRISTRELRIGMTAAVEFSLGAGKILDVLAKGVDALTKLRTLGDAVPGSFANFALQIAVLVQRVSEVSNWMDAATVAAAGRFAEGAGKVVGILGSGVDGLIKLATLSDPVPGSFQKFAVQIFALMQRISEVAGWISADAVAAAAVFAEGAGKVIGIVGAGVDGFTKLAAFTGVPKAAVDVFAYAIRDITVVFAQVASLFTTEAQAAAAQFGESAGKFVGVVGTAVDGFVKLATFAGVPKAAVDVFAYAIRDITIVFTQLAGLFTTEAQQAAALFAESAGKVVGTLKSGVDGLSALATFTGVSNESLVIFKVAVYGTISAIVYLASLFTGQALEAAAAFGSGVQRTVTMITDAIGVFAKLGEFKGTADGIVTSFTAALSALLGDLQRQVVPGATGIGVNISTGIAAGIGAGVPAMQNGLIGAVNVALALLLTASGAVVPPAIGIGVNISTGIAAGIGAGIPAIQNAVNTAVNAALAAARSLLGIASPSKVFAEIGQFSGAGLAQGLDISQATVAASANGLANAAVTPAVAAVGSRAVAAPRAAAAGADSGAGTIVNVTFASGAIVQQPGQSAQALAKEVIAEIERKTGLKIR